ncbi:MAG: RNA 2',3'-cyclic phosphodiesterase [Bacillota bacterium]|nr:RNA 2',3'-cyclic phosphodiesterase [Bacillota bacterium]MDW7684611.1 RNA 2',3'-cyclic phosphodiesterase [Bacillota bacterium]
MPRLFFAVELPPAVKESVLDLRQYVQAKPHAVKWVAQKNLHLTLLFIGEVQEDKLPQLLDSANRAAKRCRPFDLAIQGTGVFPGPARPRILWAGVAAGALQLTILADELSAVLGIAQDKAYTPHLTLGRIREGHRIDTSVFLRRGASFRADTIQIDSFCCLESTLTPQGPVYKPLRKFSLQD